MTRPGQMLRLDAVNTRGKRVLLRVDFNVPMKNGCVEDHSRIQASLGSIRKLLNEGAALMLMSHLGRPKEGRYDPELSLQAVADSLSAALGQAVPLVSNWLEGLRVEPGQAVMLENVRFLAGEQADDALLAKQMARLCDVFVYDAFATAHRAQASTHGVIQQAPLACAGPLLLDEIAALTTVLESPARPVVAIVGGAKVSGKLSILESLLERVDQLIVGGGIANTFLQAQGLAIGKSLCEPALIAAAERLLASAARQGKSIPLPTDVVCGKALREDTPAVTKAITDVADDDLIMDVGPETAAHYAGLMDDAATIFWNGPLGVFEFAPFAKGSRVLAEAIADSQAFSIAGGGDTLAAIARFGVGDKLSYISTAGGAMLEFIEGKRLPAIAALEEAYRGQQADDRS